MELIDPPKVPLSTLVPPTGPERASARLVFARARAGSTSSKSARIGGGAAERDQLTSPKTQRRI